jgi:hypothetical protein
VSGSRASASPAHAPRAGARARAGSAAAPG